MPQTEKLVVVIEDDLDIREVLQQLLEMEGYRVLTATNGQEGLLLLQKGINPSLILLDLFMPIMNGVQFLDLYKSDPQLSKFKEVPIVILSAAPPQGEVVKSVVSKVSGFIRKPVDLDQLLNVINNFCNKPIIA